MSLPRLFLLFVLLLGMALAAVNSTVSELPVCAQTCYSFALATSNCNTTDQDCACSDAMLRENFVSCIQKECPTRDALQSLNASAIACNLPQRDQSGKFILMSNAFICVTALLVGLRLFERLLSRKGLVSDDYLIILTFLIGVPSSVINSHGLAPNGLGKDIWTLTFEQITNFLRFIYINEMLYFTEVFSVKICILIFYLRIFPDQVIRRIMWVTIYANIACLIIFDFVTAFQCRPVRYYWEGWDGTHDGHCLSINHLVWANAAISVLLDFWMLALPLSQIRHMKLHWKKKVGVSLMFAVGMFVTAVSIVRLQSLVKFGNSPNPTWDHYGTAYWSTIELNVAVCCACMPNLRLLLSRVFPRSVESSARSGTDGHSLPTLSRRRNEGREDGSESTKGIAYSRSFQIQYGHRENGSSSSTTEQVGLDLESSRGAPCL